jgi:3-deoxy-D-manno-octulosonic-acid transferase
LKIKGIYLLYRLLQAFGSPAVLIYFLMRSARNRAYLGTLGQRFGFLPASFRQTVPGAIWLQAVSVGEAISAVELVRQLRQTLPRSPVFVSVSTLAGFQAASQSLDGAAVFYAPVDYAFAVRRVLRTLRPSLVIVMETEIWPNLFRETKRTDAGLMIVNGRISDRKASRYGSLRWFFGGALAQVDVILAQSQEMRRRFIQSGAPPEKVRVAGNLKYDFRPREASPDSPVRRLIERLEPRAVWVAASTMPPVAPGDPDEDDAVIAAFQEVVKREPGLLLLLAPRKPEYFDAAARKLEAAGVPFIRRSGLRDSDTLPLPGALLLDSIGELSTLFPVATVVFMGGTLAARGGHNILEPALFARPVIAGPHLENFADIAVEFRAAGALIEIKDAEGLAAAVTEALVKPEWAAATGARGQARAHAMRGATAIAVREAHQIFATCVPSYRPEQPDFFFLWILSRVWLWGAGRNRRRDLARRWQLEAPVISVGNITAGGTGKTPVVLFIAEKMKAAGWRPGILTRGHGRHSPVKHDAGGAGEILPVERSGDEPQILLRAGVAPVGIGPDRWQAGRLLERQFGVNLMILDDGFQHLRLERQADIVLIDSLSPFGGGYPLPLGRLREPLAGLSRADIFVITRTPAGRTIEGIEDVLRRHNPHAPVFHTCVRPLAWIAHPTGEVIAVDALPYSRVAAFCGLGNPESFWQTLSTFRFNVADRLQFADHHRYKPRELRFMAHQFRDDGVQAVLTTEKDIVNLCEDADHFLAPLPLYFLRIGVGIDRAREFLDAIAQLVS